MLLMLAVLTAANDVFGHDESRSQMTSWLPPYRGFTPLQVENDMVCYAASQHITAGKGDGSEKQHVYVVVTNQPCSFGGMNQYELTAQKMEYCKQLLCRKI